MELDVSISGIGMVTPLGLTTYQTWASLLAGQSIKDHALVPLTFDRSESRIAQLARLAARQALDESQWRDEQIHSENTALVVGTSKGAIVDWITPVNIQRRGQYAISPLKGFGPSMTASLSTALATDLNIIGPKQTIVAACASSLLALIRASCLVATGHCDRALVVAAESSIHSLFLSSFARLGVLAKPEIGCRPFDRTRHGFLMSEMAVAVCLDRQSEGIKISQCAMGADAYHLTGTDPQGKMLRRMLKTCSGHGEPIDLIHGHATGTITNDPVELAALMEIFGDESHPPCVYSHKGALGHSLGAAGLLAVAINVLCHRNGIVPGNIKTVFPLPAAGLEISRTPTHRSVKRSIALAAGFGGAGAAVLLGTE